MCREVGTSERAAKLHSEAVQRFEHVVGAGNTDGADARGCVDKKARLLVFVVAPYGEHEAWAYL